MKYVLLRSISPGTRAICTAGGPYDISTHEEGTEVYGWEIVEFSVNVSASEWMRMLDLRDAMNRVAEVLES